MRKRWTTASRLDRGEVCPASTVLPETYSPEGKAATWGKAVHSWAENKGVLGPREDDRETGQKQTWPKWVVDGIAKKAWVSGVKPEDMYQGGRHEVSVVLDGPTFRDVTVLPDSRFPDAPTSLRVKIDFVGTKAGLPRVSDLKTGRYPPLPTTLQLGAAALAISVVEKSEDGVHGSIEHWPRYPLEGKPVSKWHFYDEAELDKVTTRLVDMRQRALADPEPNPGSHCLYCPCLVGCPKREEAEAAIEGAKSQW